MKAAYGLGRSRMTDRSEHRKIAIDVVNKPIA